MKGGPVPKAGIFRENYIYTMAAGTLAGYVTWGPFY